MAKTAERHTPKKKTPGKAAKKSRMAKKIVKKTGNAAAVKTATKTTAAKRTATKATVMKKASTKKLPAKLAKKSGTVKAAPKTKTPKTKTIETKTIVKPTRPATRKQSVPQPVQPSQPGAATLKPAATVSPQPTQALQTPEVFTNRGEVMAEGFQPGQRVRHRYEHWWGTIVQKAGNSGGTGNSGSTAAAPAAVLYIVKLDGGQNRNDIRPEDLTVS